MDLKGFGLLVRACAIYPRPVLRVLLFIQMHPA